MPRTFQWRKHAKRGVTLVELMVSIVLFALVAAAGYKAFIQSTQTAIRSQKKSIDKRKLQQFFETFRHQIENTIQLPNAGMTALQVRIPNNVTLPGDASPKSCFDTSVVTQQVMGWGFIPYPGMSSAQLTNFLTNNPIDANPIDPSDTTVFTTADQNSDAITLVYVLPDTQTYVVDVTAMDETQIAITSATPLALSLGDYAVISDANGSDLFRITDITQSGNTYSLEHSLNSMWNNLIDPTNGFGGPDGYGIGVAGGAFVYKVGIATYALDMQDNLLMLDAHHQDDGFNGTSFPGSPGLAFQWSPAAENIETFQILYETSLYGEVRTPFANVPSKTFGSCISGAGEVSLFCGCDNQLGNPGLLNVRLNIQYTSPTPTL